MARKRASMREGPLAELFRATEAAQRQRQAEEEGAAPPVQEPLEARAEPLEETVEHVPSFGVIDEPGPPAPEPPAPPTPTTLITARYAAESARWFW